MVPFRDIICGPVLVLRIHTGPLAALHAAKHATGRSASYRRSLSYVREDESGRLIVRRDG